MWELLGLHWNHGYHREWSPKGAWCNMFCSLSFENFLENYLGGA